LQQLRSAALQALSTFENVIVLKIGKMKVKLFLCLTKYHLIKMYPMLN